MALFLYLGLDDENASRPTKIGPRIALEASRSNQIRFTAGKVFVGRVSWVLAARRYKWAA